jgi:hypothetical protein
MKKALGKKGLIFTRIVLGLAHFQFGIAQISFTLQSLQSNVEEWTGTLTPLWVYGLAIWAIYTPIVWIRKFEFLSKAFLFAIFCIVLGVLTTSVYAV